MTCNIGKTDRMFRVAAGLILLGLAVYTGGTAGWIMGAVGLIPLVTGLVGVCPAYSLFKIDTCHTPKV